MANLKFSVSEPTTICVTGTYIDGWTHTGLLLVTTEANGYTTAFAPACCEGGPTVPTLSEWGLILFGVVLFGTLVWYLRRRRHAAIG